MVGVKLILINNTMLYFKQVRLFWDYIQQKYPHSSVSCSGDAVGLPDGQMGNSEVGHMTIGSGRINLQTLSKINKAITDKKLESNDIIRNNIAYLQQNRDKTCHILGLLSDGGVHSHQDHILELASIYAKNNCNVKLHIITDGRDAGIKSAGQYLDKLDKLLKKYNNIQIATIIGRYYAMDRDNNWERTEKAYANIFWGKATDNYRNHKEAITDHYQNDIYDEFIASCNLNEYSGINDGDTVLCANFRADRVRQILKKIVNHRKDNELPRIHNVISMVNYAEDIDPYCEILFPNVQPDNVLGEVLASNGISQLRIAETEKYAHVTFFFNGGREQEFNLEDRILIPSPKVKTYDLLPEMSAMEVTDKIIEHIDKYDVIITNFANTDMVGHTGNLSATIKAVETVDACLHRIYKAISAQQGNMIITADHGNAELMFDVKSDMPHTQHTTNDVPFFLLDSSVKLQNGNLSDISPTILDLLNIEQPVSMTGKSLIEK